MTRNKKSFNTQNELLSRAKVQKCRTQNQLDRKSKGLSLLTTHTKHTVMKGLDLGATYRFQSMHTNKLSILCICEGHQNIWEGHWSCLLKSLYCLDNGMGQGTLTAPVLCVSVLPQFVMSNALFNKTTEKAPLVFLSSNPFCQELNREPCRPIELFPFCAFYLRD